jgi:hypothetical protein
MQNAKCKMQNVFAFCILHFELTYALDRPQAHPLLPGRYLPVDPAELHLLANLLTVRH